MSIRNMDWSTNKTVLNPIPMSAEIAWVKENVQSNSFAKSLNEKLKKFGQLTDGQIAAVKKIIATPAEQAAPASCNAASVKAIQDAFAKARANGIQRPKMSLATYKFKPAPTNGRNPNAIYVTDGDNYLGKIDDAQFHATKECTDEQRSEIVAVCSSPHKAAVAYGLRTGNCAICNRVLSRKDSIDLGVGAICAEKYGFTGFAAQFTNEQMPQDDGIFEDLFSTN